MVEEARKKVTTFINENPYPSYDTIMHMLQDKFKDGNDAEYVCMRSEYGQENHEWMKQIYENISDEELIRKNGRKIYNRGDETAMVYNFYTLLAVLNFIFKAKGMTHDEMVAIMYPVKTQVSRCWDGVGIWRD